jgi:hypothetical protein
VFMYIAMKIPFMFPFLGIARPQSQFPHSCVCERFIHSQDRSTYFPAVESKLWVKRQIGKSRAWIENENR